MPDLSVELAKPSWTERMSLYLLALIQFVHFTDFLIMMPLGPQFIRIFEISPAAFGSLVSCYALSAGFAALLASVVIDRFPRKLALLVAFAVCLSGTLVCAFAHNVEMLAVGRVIAGAGGGVQGAVLLAFIGDIVPNYRRGWALGIVMSAFSFASIFGVPIGLTLANLSGWHMPFLAVSGTGSIVLVLGMIFLPRAGARDRKSRFSARSMASQFWEVASKPTHLRALAVMILLVCAGFVVIPYISPVMVANVKLKESQLPLIYLVGGLATIFSMNLVGRLADRFGALRVFVYAAAASMGTTLLLTHLPPVPVYLVIASTTLFMIGGSGRMVPAMTLITNSVDARYRGAFMSLNSAAQQFAAGGAALVAGQILTQAEDGRVLHYNLAGWVSVGLAVLAIGVALGLGKTQTRTDVTEHELEGAVEGGA
jgi:predicted MFS family arabinose efflux permease